MAKKKTKKEEIPVDPKHKDKAKEWQTLYRVMAEKRKVQKSE
jgi:hypothetical protein